MAISPQRLIRSTYIARIARSVIFAIAQLSCYISDRPTSWICDDVIMLHPVIDFHGPNIVLQIFTFIGCVVIVKRRVIQRTAVVFFRFYGTQLRRMVP